MAGEGWVVTYDLLAPEWGQVLVFILSEFTHDENMEVIAAYQGAKEGYTITDEPKLDLALG